MVQWDGLFALVLVVLIGTALAVVFISSVLGRRCPGCRHYRLKPIGILLSNPGRGGRYYACESCTRRWFWSEDRQVWEPLHE
jgi:hypothetical protein